MWSEIVSGWKDIANYFGKGVRTVQRYERELGLPVRRPAGRAKGSVIATKAELGAWVEARRLREHSEFPDPSPLSVCDSLTQRTAEIRELANQMEKLILEIRAFREMLQDPVRSVHADVNARPNDGGRIGSRFTTSSPRDYQHGSKGVA
jgi:hypothetical protein